MDPNYANPNNQHHTDPDRQIMLMTRRRIAEHHVGLSKLFNQILRAFNSTHDYKLAHELKLSAREHMRDLGSLYDSIDATTHDATTRDSDTSKWRNLLARYEDMIRKTSTVMMLVGDGSGRFDAGEDKSERTHGVRWNLNFRRADANNQ
jgi:hypothetical protein